MDLLREQLDTSQERARELLQRVHQAAQVSRELCVGRRRRRAARGVGRASACAGARPGRSPGCVLGSAGAADGAVEASRQKKAQLRQALISRPLVDQARGVLMDTSRRTNTKLRTVAETVVAGAADGRSAQPLRGPAAAVSVPDPG
ncbi:hypothetical protein [Streptomyces venezuelae]|uniref:hypothetical protein n=1 Tax=Streptomyces venezuelae TaxID=54571 RepID=UPI0037B5B774